MAAMSIGRKSLLSRLVTLLAPSHVDSVTELRAWLSPSEPHWLYVPIKGPYRLIRCDVDEERLYCFETFKELHDAIMEFAMCHGPRRGEMCVIVDGRQQIVVGWEDPEKEGRFDWSGCAFAFQLLSMATAFVDPMTVTMWEAAAHARNEEWGPQ